MLGIILTIGAFLSFFPLLIIGGIASGSVAFAFGFPIFLMILGATMAYYGFYFKEPIRKSSIQMSQLAKWGIIYSVAILLANYIISKFIISDNFVVILITALLISIIAQVVKSHESQFKFNWFLFYFLIYANVIWTFEELIIPKIFFQTSVYSSILLGFILAGLIGIIQKLNLRQNTLPWISTVLVLILLASNLGSVISIIENPIPPVLSPLNPNNTSTVSESDLTCPTPNIQQTLLLKAETALKSNQISGTLSSLIDASVWKIENKFRPCYQGKWKGQFPDWFYCDDLIVSRWETTTSGTINYRWYTAVTAKWRPEEGKYVFDDFSCEGGKKITVNKEKPTIYTHDSKDGTVINVQISRDGTKTTIEY